MLQLLEHEVRYDVVVLWVYLPASIALTFVDGVDVVFNVYLGVCKDYVELCHLLPVPLVANEVAEDTETQEWHEDAEAFFNCYDSFVVAIANSSHCGCDEVEWSAVYVEGLVLKEGFVFVLVLYWLIETVLKMVMMASILYEYPTTRAWNANSDPTAGEEVHPDEG